MNAAYIYAMSKNEAKSFFLPFLSSAIFPFSCKSFPPSLPPSTCSTDLEMPSEEQGKLLSTKICLMQQRFFPCSGAGVSGWEQFFFPPFSPNGRAYMHGGGVALCFH